MIYRAHHLPAAAKRHDLISNLRPATSMHPAAVVVPAIAASWLVAGAWMVFGGTDTSTVLAMVTVILVMYAGLMLGGGAFAHNVTPDQARSRTFTDFLKGHVDTATGLLTGRQALVEIATMPVILALGGTVILVVAALAGF